MMFAMVKRGTILLFFLWLTTSVLPAQPHISKAFELESERTIAQNVEGFTHQGMLGWVKEDVLYCCYRGGFQNKETGFAAEVISIDLTTGYVENFTLPLPEKKVSALAARKYWIRGIGFVGNKIALSVQNGLLIYRQGRDDHYEFEERIAVELPDKIASKDDKLLVVRRNPEEGRFVLERQHDGRKGLDSIKELQLSAPFMLQYEPNGFVKLSEGSVYFLASPELRIEKYDDEGKKMSEICPQLPKWRAIPDKLVRKISEMPYGSDRAMFTFFQTKTYSFPLEVNPLCDSVLLLSYHQYDSIEKKEGVFTALIAYDQTGRVTRIEPYTHFFPTDSIIERDAFPLYYAQRELCLQVTDGDRIVQIVREAPVEWRGLTGQQYIGAAEQYFADHPPVVRVRVARLKTNVAEHSCDIGELGLRAYNGEIYDGSEYRDKKVVFVVHNPPQCHDCEESLLNLMNTLDTTKCKLMVVFNNADSYLAKQDQMANVRKKLKISFTPLFVPSEKKDEFLKTLGAESFPAVLLKEAGTMNGTVLFGEQIFGNGRSSVPDQMFVRKITKFLYGKGGTGK